MNDAFFLLHDGLTREGPGEPADVAWATALAGTPPVARILDAGTGAGGDIRALLAAAPEGRVLAVDTHPPFVAHISATYRDDPRVTAEAVDMLAPEGPFDLIWSAGAVYFHGPGTALAAWRPRLAPGGAVAFSEPCFFTETPSEAARAFWDGYVPQTEAALAAEIAGAGFRALGTRRLGDAAWEAYFGPLDARIATLRPGAGADLTAVLDEAEAEAAAWRACRAETGYLLTVAVPA